MSLQTREGILQALCRLLRELLRLPVDLGLEELLIQQLGLLEQPALDLGPERLPVVVDGP